jgi:hypothetical protein
MIPPWIFLDVHIGHLLMTQHEMAFLSRECNSTANGMTMRG